MFLAEVEFGQAASTTLGPHIVCSAVHIRSWGSRQEFATTLCYKVFPSAWNGDKCATKLKLLQSIRTSPCLQYDNAWLLPSRIRIAGRSSSGCRMNRLPWERMKYLLSSTMSVGPSFQTTRSNAMVRECPMVMMATILLTSCEFMDGRHRMPLVLWNE